MNEHRAWPSSSTGAGKGDPDCPECGGTGEIVVGFRHGRQMQDMTGTTSRKGRR